MRTHTYSKQIQILDFVQDKETSELEFKTVKFTYEDVLHFAKRKFCLWKTAVQRSEDDAKACKKEISNTMNKRAQRKKHVSITNVVNERLPTILQRKDDCFKALKQYKEQFKTDPSAFLDK